MECVGGDLTIKIEDNTDSGSGILSKRVEFKIKLWTMLKFYAKIDQIILLKIRPFQENFNILFINRLHEVYRFDALKDACCILPEGQRDN